MVQANYWWENQSVNSVLTYHKRSTNKAFIQTADNIAAGRDELSSGLKVFELREKPAEFRLSTQGNKETLRERLASFFEGNKDHDIFSDDPPNETEMTNFIASSTQVTIPVNDSASGTEGSQDLEAFDIKAKLNSVCEDIELLKLNFEALKRLKRSPWITSELKERMHERDI